MQEGDRMAKRDWLKPTSDLDHSVTVNHAPFKKKRTSGHGGQTTRSQGQHRTQGARAKPALRHGSPKILEKKRVVFLRRDLLGRRDVRVVGTDEVNKEVARRVAKLNID